MGNDTIFTTLGHINRDLVELKETVTCDNDDCHVLRTDKYLKSTGEWVGNDIHVTMKRHPGQIHGQQATL